MEQYLISRDGVELSRHDSYLEAVGQLHRLQSQSADWAIKYEGYAITEVPAIRASSVMYWDFLASLGHSDLATYVWGF